MKYKTIMLDAGSYAKLAYAKGELRRRSGLKIGFNGLLMELLAARPDLLDMNESLKSRIFEFVDRLKLLDFVCGIVLFGSVAKSTYTEYSDIDMLVVVESSRDNQLSKIFDASKPVGGEASAFSGRGLPYMISPLVVPKSALARFRPFYFDIADYGIVLYERKRALTDFIYSIRKMKHRREIIDGIEVLEWQ